MATSTSEIQPFQISVPDTALEALRLRLSLSTLPSAMTSSTGNQSWDQGTPVSEVERLVKYWHEKFDWRAAEKNLNESLPQFKTSISIQGFGDIGVHFIWKKAGADIASAGNSRAIPLLFVHGWPGSFYEASKFVKQLSEHGRESNAPAFDIVVPSLPNYGFSDGVTQTGFGLPQYAETFNKLMIKLGYEHYVTQGGDWGFYITRTLGLLYPQHCKASHINMPHGYQPKFQNNPVLALQYAFTPYTDKEKRGIQRTDWFLNEGSGYRAEQSTKPQTIGYALADSPVALLAWIFEKLHDWTDSYPWTDDEICTWISIYWFSTAGPAANVRIYYEAVHPTSTSGSAIVTRERLQQWIPEVKLGLAFFPKELRHVPRTWARTMGPVIFESEWEKGGHFAAWERPDAVIQDLTKMFGKGGPGYGVVPGRDGYSRETRL